MPCKILIRTKDKVPPGHPKHFLLPRAWEVVTVIPATGWDLGRKTMASDEVIWVASDMNVTEAEQHFLATDIGEDTSPPDAVRRLGKLDQSLLPQAIRTAAAANTGLALTRPKRRDEAEAEVTAWFVRNNLDPNQNQQLFASMVADAMASEPIVNKSHDEIRQEYEQQVGIPFVLGADLLAALVLQDRPPITESVVEDLAVAL